MARGHQKIQSQQKNAQKQADAKKKTGHDQKTAAKAALVHKCTICMAQMPDPKTYKQHFESKHPKNPLPAELWMRMTTLAVVLLLLNVAVQGRMFGSSSSSSSSESEEVGDGKLVLSKANFNHDAYRRMKVSTTAQKLEGDALVDYVNSRQDLWTASMNTKFANYTHEQKAQLMGVLNVRNPIKARRNVAPTHFMDVQLPDSFDARQQWGSMCASVTEIRDQSSCGSCWAFGATEAMSDRICIASKGQKQPSISALNLLSCCKACGFGCNGGEPFEAWSYWHTSGIVTGSNFSRHEGCYTGGIYVHQGGLIEGGHAVKLVGWGSENNVPYWIVANSWNTDFGEDEGGVVGGLPDLKRSGHVHHHHESSDDFF
ncbi:Cathepsin B-like cysteine proteinase [Aphelenchoides fujianensis]|nr:Cathepsin B-like cysteine proteinase [Aphelenchoides fujianensis]